MTAAQVERRLAAVLAADVAGYSRLMGADEEGTLSRLKDHAGGRLSTRRLPSTGAASSRRPAMACWSSLPAWSTRCAARWRFSAAWPSSNAPCREAKRIEFRIGIHVGDIIIDDDDIFGDGVNIAARLEGIAEPGGICISTTPTEQVRGKLDIASTILGEQQLKNIARPVRVFRVRVIAAAIPPMRCRMSPPLALPDKPSIAVLPFPEHERRSRAGVFRRRHGRGHHHRALALRLAVRHRAQFELHLQGQAPSISSRSAANSACAMCWKAAFARRATGAHHRTADRRTTGTHLWADRFDGGLEDVFDLQDRGDRQALWSDLAEARTGRNRTRQAQAN